MLRMTVAGSIELGLAIAWKIKADLMSQGGQSARQRAYHVGESTGLRERNAFRSNERDVHESKDLRARRPLLADAGYYGC